MQDYLAREWQARSSYPVEVERWYAFLYEVQSPVEALMRRADDLAVRHKLTPLRSLVALPLALKLRDEEIAAELQARCRSFFFSRRRYFECVCFSGCYFLFLFLCVFVRFFQYVFEYFSSRRGVLFVNVLPRVVLYICVHMHGFAFPDWSVFFGGLYFLCSVFCVCVCFFFRARFIGRCMLCPGLLVVHLEARWPRDSRGGALHVEPSFVPLLFP